ncbi:hypothetical protein CQ018_01420 [Arthrobacter sp. MYb227]|uniref:putative acetyltransferase n=1 Tax=Arthrobacter sp. MYb227 TaxID=1848601 RepID=UPI000CFCB519|nr:hypothetical protein [Arthrobacter sp. MYb227]PQZ95975.1 hypothetical protein CQ018_01420 [Arthrobacter sp. MYb227]
MNSDLFASLAVGARVVVRYRLAPKNLGIAGESVTDALGYLEEINETSVTVKTREATVHIERSLITHAKEVPPPPVRRTSLPRQS